MQTLCVQHLGREQAQSRGGCRDCDLEKISSLSCQQASNRNLYIHTSICTRTFPRMTCINAYGVFLQSILPGKVLIYLIGRSRLTGSTDPHVPITVVTCNYPLPSPFSTVQGEIVWQELNLQRDFLPSPPKKTCPFLLVAVSGPHSHSSDPYLQPAARPESSVPSLLRVDLLLTASAPHYLVAP